MAGSRRCGSSRPADLDAEPDDDDGRHVRVLPAGPAGLRSRLPGWQLRPGRVGHSWHQRPGNRRSAIRGLSAVQHGLQRARQPRRWNPIFRDERTYSIAANVTKLKGRHDLRGGYILNFMYLDHWQPETGNPRGNFKFLGNTTSVNGAAQSSNFYNQYAAFMLGLVGNVNKSVQNELMTAREWQNAIFFRDRWSATSKLTLDLGLRWEYYPIMTASMDEVSTGSTSQPRSDVAGRGGNPQEHRARAGLDNFAPRVGAVYRLNDKTVFRTGYGMTYNAMAGRAPYAVTTTIRSRLLDLHQAGSVRVLQPARAGHSAHRRSGSELGASAAAERGRRSRRRDRQHRSRHGPDLERRLRAPAAVTTSPLT